MWVVREEGEHFRAVEGEGQAGPALAEHQVVGVWAAEDAAEADALAGEEGAVERADVAVGEAGKVPTGGGVYERGRVGEAGVGLPVRVGHVVARLRRRFAVVIEGQAEERLLGGEALRVGLQPTEELYELVLEGRCLRGGRLRCGLGLLRLDCGSCRRLGLLA